MVAAGVAAAMVVTRIFLGSCRKLIASSVGRRAVILTACVQAVMGAAVAARHRAEQGQTLIIGVRCLNFFAIINGSRRSYRTSGSRRDQGGGKNTVQDKSQGFIL